MLLQKGMDTVNLLSRDNKVIIFTDGSSDNSFTRGGAGIYILHPAGIKTELKYPSGLIASNFTCELVAIKEALSFYISHYSDDPTEGLVCFTDSKSALEAIHIGNTKLTQDIIALLCQINKPCTLQWIPAHVGIEGNECADILAKEARDLNQPRTVTFVDANAAAKRRIFDSKFSKPSIPDLNCPRHLSSIVARLRTGHLKGMKIAPDNTRSYVPCGNCSDAELTPEHIFDCQAVIRSLFQLGDPPQDLLYSMRAPELAALIAKAFGTI